MGNILKVSYEAKTAEYIPAKIHTGNIPKTITAPAPNSYRNFLISNYMKVPLI